MKVISYENTPKGLWIETDDGEILLQNLTDSIVRCIYSKDKVQEGFSAIGVQKQNANQSQAKTEIKDDILKVAFESIELEINIENGGFQWCDAKTKRCFLRENAKELTRIDVQKYTTGDETPIIDRVKTVDGERNFVQNLRSSTDREAYRAKMHFAWKDKESIHGLGQGEEGIYNYRGATQYLYQHNMRIPVPFLISDQNYAILFDCGSLMTFNDDCRGSYVFMDTVEQLDYYIIYGDSFDKLIHGYRQLTGKASMLPKWAFGYVQSKEAYSTQEELVSVAEEYRKRKIPLDCVVQDWNTWEQGQWGNKRLDKSRYPNVAQTNKRLHELNVHSMVSVWPNMNNGCADYEEMQRAGHLLYDYATYNAFNKEARRLYWKQMNRELFQGGFDSWWCDSTEPFSGPDWGGETLREPWERFALVGNEHKKYLDPAYANLFALKHAQGIYENQRKQTKEKRVLNLTRSGYAGSQRYGTVLWSGDITADWETMRKQIVEGLNFCMSGLPYWTLDIGGFFTVGSAWQNRGCGCSGDPTPKWFWQGKYNEGVNDLGYREIYVRWFQYGAFLPMFRSHGTDTPREVWRFGEPGTPFHDTLVRFIELRYKLMPYIYSASYQVTQNDDTIMRSLIFDFPHDRRCKEIANQYMFGRSILVCPVTEPMYYDAESVPLQREHQWTCYLPKGAGWYDFWQDIYYEGGQHIEVDAPIEKIPLFVKAGSIIPMEEGLEYANQKSAQPFQIHIYPGRDCDFQLYEDQGDGYDYEQGDYNCILLHWDDKRMTLSIGEAIRDFNCSIKNRDVIVTLHGQQVKKTSFHYTGLEMVIQI